MLELFDFVERIQILLSMVITGMVVKNHVVKFFGWL